MGIKISYNVYTYLGIYMLFKNYRYLCDNDK